MTSRQAMRLRPGDLRADQLAIACHPARFKVVACGRRWGKTTLGLVMAIHAARHGRQVWWVAPTISLAFQPWRDMKRILHREWTVKLEAEHFIELLGGGTLTVKSADEPDSLRGVGLDAVVIDEAAFMFEEAWTAALRPALSDRAGRVLIISTPRGRNWFYHAHQRGLDPLVEDWASWHYPTESNPLIPPQEIADARALLSARIFQQEYEAAFLADGGSVFRGLEAAATAPLDATPVRGKRYVMGVDFGRYEDFTVCAILDADTREMVALDRFSEVNWGVQRSRIAALARRWDCWQVLAEANAMGEPNIEALHREERIRIKPFTTSAKNKAPLIESLVAAIENGDLTLLPDPVLLSELEGYTYSTTPYGNTVYGPQPGRHDDTVIALALAWKAATTPRIALAVAAV